MTWVIDDGKSPIEGSESEAHHSEKLYSDKSVECVGYILQFYEDAPYYGGCAYGRTGPMRDLKKCRAAVERMAFQKIEDRSPSL